MTLLCELGRFLSFVYSNVIVMLASKYFSISVICFSTFWDQDNGIVLRNVNVSFTFEVKIGSK